MYNGSNDLFIICYLLWIDLVNLAKDSRRPISRITHQLLDVQRDSLGYFQLSKERKNKKRPDSCRDVSKFTKPVLVPFLFTT